MQKVVIHNWYHTKAIKSHIASIDWILLPVAEKLLTEGLIKLKSIILLSSVLF